MTEMFGYEIAASDLGLTHEVRNKMVTLPPYGEVNKETFFVHYNYFMFVGFSEQEKKDSPWLFHKCNTFMCDEPKSLIKLPPPQVRACVKHVISYLNFVLEQVYKITFYPDQTPRPVLIKEWKKWKKTLDEFNTN